MKIIAGLGNPGSEYAKTKHNVGFMFLDAFARKYDVISWRTKQDMLVADLMLGGEKTLLVKPLTFMNESGRAIGPLLAWYKLPAESLIVVHDDMDLPVGTVRLRKKGSAGGHNGMKSVLYHVQNEIFGRVRIGIGHPLVGRDVISYVLSPFSTEEQTKIDEAIQYLIPAVECMATKGVDYAMNRYNPRRAKKPSATSEEEQHG